MMNLKESSTALEILIQQERSIKEIREKILSSTVITIEDLEEELKDASASCQELLVSPQDTFINQKAFLVYHNTITRLLNIIFNIKSSR